MFLCIFDIFVISNLRAPQFSKFFGLISSKLFPFSPKTCSGKAPSRKLRSDCLHSNGEMQRYLGGAVHPQWGRLPSAGLMAAITALSYWRRFQLYVAFVEQAEGQQETVLDYMAIDRVKKYFNWLGEGSGKKGAKWKHLQVAGWVP